MRFHPMVKEFRSMTYATAMPSRAISRPDPGSAPRGRRTVWLRLASVLLAVALLTSLEASAGDKKTRNTLVGAGLGAVGGALLSNGDPWATVGGAAAGGLIGNVITHDSHHHDRRGDRRDDRRRYDRGRDNRRRGHGR
jgi:hypothetical protein